MTALTVTNISQGNTAQFVAEFLDANGNITIPTGATLNITYPTNNQGSSTATTAITMTANGSFFTATWASSVSSLGLAPWNITSVASTSPQASGTLRIITP